LLPVCNGPVPVWSHWPVIEAWKTVPTIAAGKCNRL
jgi:hypothetical protein